MDGGPTARFGDLLRRYRLAAGLTQEELAERARLSTNAISDLERGARQRPRRATVELLAGALCLDASAWATLEAAARRARPSSVERLESVAPADRAAARTNLPLQVTSFVGREHELAEVKQLLGSTRLLTLTGTGGCGKTRLALEAAARVVDSFADGVWLVELEPVADADLVIQTVLAVLGAPEVPGQVALATLVTFLRSRELLLVLDNCEHLIKACASLAHTLLRSCAQLRVLATSREPLRIGGEVTWRVPSLSFPPPDTLLANETDAVTLLRRYEAARLFEERARSAAPSFAITPEGVGAVAELCRRLDGIPLAIELAAARIAVLSVEQIAERLDQRFRLLTGGSRAVLSRHRTLAALIDWSYDLLTAPERTLFGRLAVFAGGFTLEAAEAVCSDDGPSAGIGRADSPPVVPRGDVLDLLNELVNKSLVGVGRGEAGTVRYALLESLRAYGFARLEESGDAPRIQEHHAAHYLALAVATVPGPDGFDRLEREHNNLRTALRWFLTKDDAERALRLGAAVWGFWAMRGHLTEGRQQLAALLKLPESAAPPEIRAEVLQGAGRIAFNQSDFPAAQAWFEQSLRSWRKIGDTRKTSHLLDALGHLHRERGDFALARALLDESLALARASGDWRQVAVALNYRGLVALQEGDYAASRALLEECLELQRVMSDTELGRAWTACRLGHVAHAEGDPREARRLYAESMATLRRWEDKRGIANLLTNLGMVEVDEGDAVAARARLREGTDLLRDLRDPVGTALLLDAWAGLAVTQEDLARALRLAGAAAALRESSGTRHARNLMDWLERVLAPARQELGEEVARARWAEGQAMTLEQALACALAVGDDGPATGAERSSSTVIR